MPPYPLLPLLILLVLPSSLIASLRGVHPTNLTHYTSPYSCLPRDNPISATPITLSASQLNDNYCHCRDGSDEPGTSACPNAFFSCINAAYRSKQIPSSWVDDLVCDCCDGSDENPGICPDVCLDLKGKDREQVTNRANAIWRAVKTRQLYIQQAVKGKEKQVRELAKLDRELKSLSRRLKHSETLAHGLHKQRDLNEKLKADQLHHNHRDEGEKEEAHADYDYHRHDHYDDDHAEEDQPEDHDLLENDALDDDLDDYQHLEKDHPDLYDDEQDDHFDEDDDDIMPDEFDDEDLDDDEYDDHDDADQPQDEPQEKSHLESVANESGDSASVSPGEEVQQPLDLDNVCARLVSRGPNPFKQSLTYIKLMLLSKLKRVLPKAIHTLAGSAVGQDLDECVRKADQVKWDLQREKGELERKIREIQAKIGIDYGPDGEFWPLHGKCVRKKLGQYEFEICTFDRVRQFEHGRTIATLGRYSGWGQEEARGKVMEYKNGDRCWDGPQRSTQVELLCGEEEDIVSVEEPSRCTYVMRFETPAVCFGEEAEALLAEFEDGEGTEKQEL